MLYYGEKMAGEGEREIPRYLKIFYLFNGRIVLSVVISMGNLCLRISSNLGNRVGVWTVLFIRL